MQTTNNQNAETSTEMNIAHARYEQALLCLEQYRKRGGLWKHLWSVPYQWRRNYWTQNIIRRYQTRTGWPYLPKTERCDVVVSLTSFPKRINTVHLAIKSMLLQSILPHKIVLWLSTEEFPEKENELPDTLTELQKHGLEIHFVSRNLRAHQKYYYAFQHYPDSRILTIDDDLIYPPYTLERLLRLSIAYPQAICANVVRCITIGNNDFKPYPQWPKSRLPHSPLCSHHYVGMGYGGILYPPKWYDQTLFDLNLITQHCPLADDLWLKANELRRQVPVATTEEYFPHPPILPCTKKSGLQLKNNGRTNMNDTQWQALNRLWQLNSLFLQKNTLKGCKHGLK